MGKLATSFLITLLLISLKTKPQATLVKSRDTSVKKISLKVLPQNFYSKHMGFLCKKELQLQKTSAINIFFRLGSKEYVDYLERKPNYFIKREK